MSRIHDNNFSTSHLPYVALELRNWKNFSIKCPCLESYNETNNIVETVWMVMSAFVMKLKRILTVVSNDDRPITQNKKDTSGNIYDNE